MSPLSQACAPPSPTRIQKSLAHHREWVPKPRPPMGENEHSALLGLSLQLEIFTVQTCGRYGPKALNLRGWRAWPTLPFLGMTTCSLPPCLVAAGSYCSWSGDTSRGRARDLLRSGESTGDYGWLVHLERHSWGFWSPSAASASLTHQHTLPGPRAGFGKTRVAQLSAKRTSFQPLDWWSWGLQSKPAGNAAFACNAC